jgi:hypothetical protein
LDGVAVNVAVIVPAVEARTVQLTDELLPADIELMAEQPELLVMPVPETVSATELAVVPPLFWMLRLTVYAEPALTLAVDGVTTRLMEGGRTTLKDDDSAVDGEPTPCTFTLMLAPV